MSELFVNFPIKNKIDYETKKLYGDLGSHPFNVVQGRDRGARNVNDLTLHDMVNVATEVGITTNQIHIHKITIARNTETAHRLGAFEIKSDALLREVVYTSTAELKVDDHQIAENMIYETLRHIKSGVAKKYVGVDIIGVDQPLNVFVGRRLVCVGRLDRSEIDLDEMKQRNPLKDYDPVNKWWEMSTAHPWTLGKDYYLILTKGL